MVNRAAALKCAAAQLLWLCGALREHAEVSDAHLDLQIITVPFGRMDLGATLQCLHSRPDASGKRLPPTPPSKKLDIFSVSEIADHYAPL
jgi:hypothetical protein